MAALPLRIRQTMRDHITSPTSTLPSKIAALQTTIGYPVTFDPEWVMLWKTLESHFGEPGDFVPYIANVMVMWCDALSVFLENDANEEVVEKLLEELGRRGRVEIIVEVSPNAKRPTSSWRSEKNVFTVALSKTAPLQSNDIYSGFESDFNSLFTESPSSSSPIPHPTSQQQSTEKDTDTWTDLSFSTPSVSTQSQFPEPRPNFAYSNANTGSSNNVDILPDLTTIQRPEDLLKNPPYWLIIRQESTTRVTVQGSHAASISLLEQYLKRWCKGDSNFVNRPPMVEIKAQTSPFGMGLSSETLVLQAMRHREVSAMLVLVFVEKVLGYEMLSDGGGSAGVGVWEFKRVKGFK